MQQSRRKSALSVLMMLISSLIPNVGWAEDCSRPWWSPGACQWFHNGASSAPPVTTSSQLPNRSGSSRVVTSGRSSGATPRTQTSARATGAGAARGSH